MADVSELWGQVRHAIGAIGAGLASYGWATADEVSTFVEHLDTIAGSLMVLGAMVASFINARRTKEVIKTQDAIIETMVEEKIVNDASVPHL